LLKHPSQSMVLFTLLTQVLLNKKYSIQEWEFKVCWFLLSVEPVLSNVLVELVVLVLVNASDFTHRQVIRQNL